MRTLARIARHGGTIIPLLLCIAVCIALYSMSDGVMGWELPVIYQIVAISAVFGFYGLITRARQPLGEHMSIFLLVLCYQKAFLFIFWQCAAIISYGRPPRAVEGIGDEAGYVLLLAATVSMIVVNAVLFVFRKRHIEEEADPVPFRSLYRSWKKRRGRG